MLLVTSPTHQLVKKIASLASKKGREKHKLFCAEGTRTITTIIASQKIQLVHLICTQPMHEEAQALASAGKLIVVSDAIMNKISSSTTPSGILAVFSIPEQKTLQGVVSGVVLAGIQDPGNMGTLIRSAAALDKHAVICIGGTDPWSPKVVQSTAGAICMVDIMACDWQTLIAHKAAFLCALVVHGGLAPEKITQKNVLLVVGSESHGLPHEWINDCTLKMTIPMPGGTESLNAAVAGSIGMYLVK